MTGRVLLPTTSAGVSFRVLSRLLFARRAAAVATVVTFILTGIVALVPPWVLGSIVDDIRAGRDNIVRSAVLIGVASLAAAVLGALSVTFLARAGEPALAELREQAFDRVLHLDAQQIERAGSGDLLARLGDDVRSVSEGLSGVVPNVVNSGVAIVFTAVGVLALDWRLGLAMLVTTPIYAWGLKWYLARSTPLYRDERIAQGQRAEALVNGIHAAPTVRAFGLETLQLGHIEAASGKAVGITIAVFRLTLRFLGRSNLAELTGLLMLLVVGLYLVRADLTTLGAVTAATLYFQRLFSPIGALLFTFDQFQSIGAGLTRLVGIATLPPAPEPDDATTERPGDIVLSGISHEYTVGKPVLHDITVKLARGERVALVGSSGAGKTTLAAIAAGVLTPTRGAVTTDGRDDGGHRGLRPGAFLVSQEGHVFAGTVRDALTLAGPAASDEDINRALETVGAHRWVAALPEGADTVVGDHGHQLTPTQAQQLALARVEIRDPWFVVLDEATAEEDSAGAHELESAALAVTRGRTTLVVAHRLTQARSADRILMMHDGTVIEDGTHDELVASGGRYGELWRAWQGR